MGKKTPILIVGGGISGITTAAETAETGYSVVLVEKLPYLGGRVIKMNNYFPKLCPPICGMEINFKRLKTNPNIKLYTSTTLKKVTRKNNAYHVILEKKPEYINSSCTLCGECEKACPVNKPDEFNYNMTRQKAVGLAHEMAFPQKYIIDSDACLQPDCRKCADVCPYNAIDLSKQPETIELEVKAIVLSTGWKPYDASLIDNLKFDKHPDIITNVMLERLQAQNGPTQGKLLKPSDQSPVNTIAFIQCAGSRDENHLPYCSAVCCPASLKHAINFLNQNPNGKVHIYYIDLRVQGRNEDFLKNAQELKNISFIKGKVSTININADNALVVEAEDILTGKKTAGKVDMVVLATGIVPEKADIENLLTDEYGFILFEQEAKGIVPAGCAKKPMDVSASLKDATGSALEAIINTIIDGRGN